MGNLAVDRQPDGLPVALVAAGQLIRELDRSLLSAGGHVGRVLIRLSICSSKLPSCTSPQVPRVLTLVRTFLRSPTLLRCSAPR